jgi:glycosyltransferase involved in cell wall biosynthesis
MEKAMPGESRSPLSVAVITQDEADNLPDCLKSVAFAEQIVVVDSGSTDKTVQIARDFGCEVFLEPWRGGFGAQKQFAVDRCRRPWVLVLDADERIPPETAAAIRNIVANPSPPAAGYSFPRENHFQGRWIRHAGWWPDRVTRLFKKDFGRMTGATVHEAVHVTGTVEPLDCPIKHYTESRLSRLLLKIDKYSTLGAREAFAAGRRATAWTAISRACLTFGQDYFLRLGMLDGHQGLTLAATDAVNKFFKYAKLAELCRQADGYDRGK